MQEVGKIKSYYEMPLYYFIDLFKKVLRDSKRSKSDAGSVAARVAELNTMFTMELYKRICMNVFKGYLVLLSSYHYLFFFPTFYLFISKLSSADLQKVINFPRQT